MCCADRRRRSMTARLMNAAEVEASFAHPIFEISAIAAITLPARAGSPSGPWQSMGDKPGILGAIRESPNLLDWMLAAMSPMADRPSLVAEVENVRDDFASDF
jgi:hypothetical protein